MEQFGVNRGKETKQKVGIALPSLILIVLASCATPAPKTVRVAPPPLQLPKSDRQVEAITSPVPSKLQQINFNDPVDMAILEAQLRFGKGEELSKQGALKRAKEEFDSAIDVILQTASSYP